jgi:3-hydroxyisobutyrate dehydrogenase-like beta-hydroxyacid dehydrogenase
MSELTIGFAGLGTMGWPMAANLHAAGFALVVRDFDPARQAKFAAEHLGAIAATAPGAFAAADIVVTMLPNGAIVRNALLGWGIAAATDAPVLALTDERWSKALSEFGPAADQSMAHRAWWGDPLDGH